MMAWDTGQPHYRCIITICRIMLAKGDGAGLGKHCGRAHCSGLVPLRGTRLHALSYNGAFTCAMPCHATFIDKRGLTPRIFWRPFGGDERGKATQGVPLHAARYAKQGNNPILQISGWLVVEQKPGSGSASGRAIPAGWRPHLFSQVRTATLCWFIP